ncbi:MAG: radical SAM protein [Lachnospiraceae bacterium]|nr:radical SAM protein [Lachnospiraceae bacterium]
MNKIKTAWLTTNRSCNNQCTWCYAQNALPANMPYDKAKEVIDALAELQVKKIILIGGEPTIYGDFIHLIQYISQKKIKVGLTTNGLKFADMKFVEATSGAGLTSANISIKGTTPEEYINTTGNNGFEKMLRGYHNLKKKGISITCSYVITKDDTDEITRLLEFLKKESIKDIVFQFIKPVVSEKSQKIMEFQEMGNMVKYIYECFEKEDIRYLLELSFPFCYIDRKCLQNLIEANRIVSGCHVFSGSGIVFDANMRVLPCNHFTDFPFQGKAQNKLEIIELWKSKEVSEFRQKVCSYPSVKCKACKLWNMCGGGCFTRWLYLNPENEIRGL